MSVLRSRPVLRWLVPATAAVAVIGGGAAIGTFAAEAEPSLPPRTAAQLLVDLQTSRLEGLSGTVVQRADLGLPPLVGLAPRQRADHPADRHAHPAGLVLRAGPAAGRADGHPRRAGHHPQRPGPVDLAEPQQHRHPPHAGRRRRGLEAAAEPAASLPATPQQAADLALGAIDPSTEVSVGRSATVAGQDAYELVLQPRDRDSLVHQLRIAIDAKQHVPLRFEVLAKGSDQPAFEVAFTQVDYRRPDADQFTLQPAARRDGHGGDGRAADGQARPARPRRAGGRTRRSARWATAGRTVLVAPPRRGRSAASPRTEAGRSPGRRRTGRGPVEAARRAAARSVVTGAAAGSSPPSCSVCCSPTTAGCSPER